MQSSGKSSAKPVEPVVTEMSPETWINGIVRSFLLL